jgi:glycyl-tRNA synthetase beta chain
MVILSEPLANFFSKVMVMAEDAALKTNRIKLMWCVAQVFDTVADLSKLQNA